MKKLKQDINRLYALCNRALPASKFDYWRACFNPRIFPVMLLRLAECSQARGLPFLAKMFSLLNVLLFGLEVSPRIEIGGGLFLPHTVGTVIGAERIGENCTIMQNVTLGSALPDLNFDATTRPIIGDNVLIGAGAKVIGRVVVGHNVNIGANAVVLKDIPDNSLAVGVPAKILPINSREQK